MLFRALGGPTSDQPSASPSASPSAAEPLAWHTFNGQNGYKPACSYRFHLLIPAEKAAKISIDLSRYAGDASFIYPAIVNSHFLQAAIMEPGEPIAIDINDAKVADCGPGDAILDNLPRMCFGTKIEERCP